MRFKSVILVLFLLIITIPRPLMAQNLDELLAMNLEELMNVEVFSAGRKIEKNSEIPASIIIITRSEIERFGYDSVTDILRHVPGLYPHDDWNLQGVNFGVRGFWTNQYNRNLVFMVNGVIQREDVFGWNIASLLNIPVMAIDRIEIVRGPMSVLYGSGAFFGVIHIFTNLIDDKPNQHGASLAIGSYNEHIYSAHSSGRSGEMDYAVNAQYLHSDGMNIPFNTVLDSVVTFNGQYLKNANTRKLFEKNSWHFDLSLNYQSFYSRFQLDEIRNHFTAFAPPVYTDTYPEINLTKSCFVLGYKKRVTKKIDIDTKLEYHRFHFFFHGRHLVPHLDFGMEYDPSRSIRFELISHLHVFNNLKTTLGVQYHRIQDLFIYDDFPQLLIFNRYHKAADPIITQAAFGRMTWDLKKYLKIVAGFRFERMNPYDMKREWLDENRVFHSVTTSYDDEKLQFIPRLSLLLNISPRQSLKILYGRAFSRPSFFENLEFYGVYHPPLIPSKIETWEVNYQTAPSSLIYFNFSLFNNHLTDLIMRTIEWQGDSFLSYLDNIGKMSTQGAEFQMVLHPASRFYFDGAVTYQKTRNLEFDIDAGYAPEWLVYLKSTLNVTPRFIVSMTANYVDAMMPAWDPSPVDPDVIHSSAVGRIGQNTKSYWQAGLNFLLKHFPITSMQLNFKTDNLFNQSIYYPCTTNNQWFQKGTRGPGRTFILKATWTIN